MATRNEHLEILGAAYMVYGESLKDLFAEVMDIDNTLTNTKTFIDYINLHRAKDYGWLLSDVKHPKDVWDFFVYLENKDEIRKAVNLLVDYAVYHALFGDACYKKLRDYFENLLRNGEMEVDEFIESSFEEFMFCNR